MTILFEDPFLISSQTTVKSLRGERERVMVKLAEDLIGDILSRIPVKHLLRFRCVSKTWCALIDSKHFVKKHLNHSFLTKSKHTLTLYQFSFQSIFSVCSVLNLFSLQQPQLIQSTNPNQLISMHFGSCNGLQFVSLLKDSATVLIVWNPAPRKHVKIPKISLENPFTKDGPFDPEDVVTVYGFGYDSVSDDYHVVMLVQFFEGWDRFSFRSEAYVYSLGSNSWRKVLDFPNYCFVPKQIRCVLVSGALHFLIMVESGSKFQYESKAVSFDLVTEECNAITLPNFPHIEVLSFILYELGGCLAIVCNYFAIGVVSVWVMKEYGVTESWTQLLTIGSEIINPSEYFMALAYSESGDEMLLMVNFAKLIWYNLEKKTTKVVDVSGLPKSCYSVICFESLVSLRENAENDETQGGRNEEAEKKRKEKFLSVGFKLVL